MSVHKSLALQGRLQRSRNVLTRWERIVKMQKEERWPEERSVFGLPKIIAAVKVKKKAKKEKEETTDEEAATTTET